MENALAEEERIRLVVVVDQEAGPFVADTTTVDDVDFIRAAVTQFGGDPIVSHDDEQGWAVSASCNCTKCREYKLANPPLVSRSLIRAARHYAVMRSVWINRTEKDKLPSDVTVH